MKNRWTDSGAEQARVRWAEAHGTDFALRCYTADLIGREPGLVLHGGGNVSFKQTLRDLLGNEIDAIHVKGSGCDLAGIEPGGLPVLDLGFLRSLRALEVLDDDAMANAFRTHLFEASAPTPSIETLLHAFLPQRYVDHSHADALLALTNQPDGELRVRAALGDRVAVLPYAAPGFELARAVADLYEANPRVDAIVLLQHGLVTFGEDARSSYDRHIEIVDACERFIADRAAARSLTVAFATPDSPATLAARVAPLLRGLVALPIDDEDRRFIRSVFEWRATDSVLDFVNSAEAAPLARTGPLTTDHLIRTGPFPLFVEQPNWSDDEALRQQLREAIETYRDEYRSYVTDHGGSLDGVDPSPAVILLPGAGVFCRGRTKRDARVAADITEHALATKAAAHAIGTYTALSREHLYPMEFRAMQRAKLDSRPERPLERKIVVISGGAGAIGAAVAETCARAGAHVVVSDLDPDRVEIVVRRVEQACEPGCAYGIVMDVTDETSVRDGYAETCRHFGGVDVVVPNAGIAHVAALENLAVDDFRRVLEVNAVGYMLFMREGIRVLRRQGLGGHIVVNASKNVFGPGKDFGAYSASKAAGHQLGKVAAIELAVDNIRVNMINADAVFGDEQVPSGLWATVGPERARSRGLKTEDLPEYYRERNLLKTRVYGRHVGNAVVFFASDATPTTGATLPVDGGVVEAFPR